MALKIDVDSPISEFISKDLVTIDQSETVTAGAKKMVKNGVGALIVTEKGEPAGIFTERDILNKVVAADRDPSTTRISSVMSSPIRKIEHSAKVGDAIAEMVKYGIRRLAVVRNGKIIGLVTQRSVVSVGRSQVLLPELEAAEELRCPYCSQGTKDQKALSKHIDMMHIGKGLLQGDIRKL
jgi:signal-transduction protein with cAMP-binding, CBS, and nucleotidyltransferase domain